MFLGGQTKGVSSYTQRNTFRTRKGVEEASLNEPPQQPPALLPHSIPHIRLREYHEAQDGSRAQVRGTRERELSKAPRRVCQGVYLQHS